MHAEIFDKFAKPPVATLLGWHLIDADAKAGWARIGFQAREEFLNPAGFVQGGILSAMLDDTMGPAVLIASGGTLYTATIDLHVSFLAPAKLGRLIGEGRIVQMGKTIAFMESDLRGEDGALVARGSAAARLVPVEKLPRVV